MGTAPKKSRAAGKFARPARDVRVLESMESLIFEDDSGAYHWRGLSPAMSQASRSRRASRPTTTLSGPRGVSATGPPRRGSIVAAASSIRSTAPLVATDYATT
jgi:hypothetical protein